VYCFFLLNSVAHWGQRERRGGHRKDKDTPPGGATVAPPALGKEQNQIGTNICSGLGRRIHGSVEDTKLSTNKQHTLS
jgi:hypothetical protein